MASSPPGSPRIGDDDVKALIRSYSSRAWRSILGFFPSPDSSLLAKISNLFSRAHGSRSRRRTHGLPLILHSNASQSHLIVSEESTSFVVLDDVVEHILSCLHTIHKSLLFWQSLAEGSKAQKVYFMIFRRGPRALVDETCHMLSSLRTNGSPVQQVHQSAAETISHRIDVLSSLQCCLAKFLADVFLEVNKFKDVLAEDAEKSLPTLLVAIHGLFLKLETTISHPRQIYKSDNSFTEEGNKSCAIVFEKLPLIDLERSLWTDTEIRDATSLIYENLQRLDSYLSFVLSYCQKPGKLTLNWLRYTCGAVGISICSAWLLRHSSLTGSSDIDNWIHEARDSTIAFWKDHVEQPLFSIRDELFETFRRRHRGVMEVEEVQLTSDSLRRMLLAFCEQIKSQKLPENITDQELMEIVMSRYEKEVMHPLQNLLNGELARAMLIQIQKLKLDLETAMLELNQILRANEINFAILAALPAFFLSFILLMLIRAWVLQDKGAEGRGRIARLQRRLLVVEVEKRVMQFQICTDKGLEEDARCMFGLLLYSLDRLFKAVERHAKETGEWLSLRQDIMDLATPELKIEHKLSVVSRISRMYDCLLPSYKPR